MDSLIDALGAVANGVQTVCQKDPLTELGRHLPRNKQTADQ